MENENSVLTVTYPSLYLAGLDNISVMFLGMNDQQLERIQEIFERSYYENELIFYVTEKPLDDETIAWANMISPTLNYLIVNTDTINTVEAILAFVIEEYAKNPNVIYISFNGAQNAVSNLVLLGTLGHLENLFRLENPENLGNLVNPGHLLNPGHL